MAQEANTQTVVATFDDYATAQQASRDLINSGIPANAVSVESNLRTGAAGYGGEAQDESRNEGGISGWFHRVFGSDDDEQTYSGERGHYAEAVRRGAAVLSATVADSQVDEVTRTLNRYNPVDIEERAAMWRKSGYTGYSPEAQPYSSEDASRERDQLSNDTALPVIEEELQVGKRVVQRGGVRVYSRVVDQPVQEEITLREEHVRVERRPANRPASAEDVSRLRDQTIEVTEMAEEPVVSKRARVKEEVVVGKEATERTETVRDNVRRTEVQVDPIAAKGTETGYSSQTSDPSWDYGYRSASDTRYTGKSWTDAENDLRTDYLRTHPESKWDDVKDSIRRGWEKVTGQR